MTGLEEYWPYKFRVDAATVKGTRTSDFSNVFKTKQAGKSICQVFFNETSVTFSNVQYMTNGTYVSYF